jgi:benzylsuccinate CoA-transferase BbsF subunit
MERSQVFEGVKVLSFCPGGVGPLCVRYLANNGASAVHVESRLRPDVTRTAGPFKDNTREPDHSAWFPAYHYGEYGVTLNLGHPTGKDIALKLIKWADIVAEAFRPGVMKRLGFDYESVRKVKPDIIYFSTSAQGQYGPHADYRGYGFAMSALAGVFHLTGGPDRDPAIVDVAYNDFIAPHYGGAILVAALDYHRRTGKGQHIDLSQLECGAHFIAPVIMDYSVNKRVWNRDGNRCPHAAPHNAYRCQGTERWVAIAVTNDEEWEVFKRVIGQPAWTREPRFAALTGRKENEDELNRLVEEWTIDYSAEEVMTLMQQAGVAAGVVQNHEDLLDDPQMKHRGHFVVLDHEVVGPQHYDSDAYRLSKTPSEVRWAGFVFGQHNEYVFKELLGMSDGEIAEATAEGALE